MGSYISQDEFEELFASDEEVSYLTDTESTGVPSVTRIAEIIAISEAEIDSYIGQRFQTPVVHTADSTGRADAILRGQTYKVAKYYAFGRKPNATEGIKQAYDDAIAWAKAVGKGEATLPGAVTLAGTATRSPLASWTGSNRDLSSVKTRIFSRETMSSL